MEESFSTQYTTNIISNIYQVQNMNMSSQLPKNHESSESESFESFEIKERKSDDILQILNNLNHNVVNFKTELLCRLQMFQKQYRQDEYCWGQLQSILINTQTHWQSLISGTNFSNQILKTDYFNCQAGEIRNILFAQQQLFRELTLTVGADLFSRAKRFYYSMDLAESAIISKMNLLAFQQKQFGIDQSLKTQLSINYVQEDFQLCQKDFDSRFSDLIGIFLQFRAQLYLDQKHSFKFDLSALDKCPDILLKVQRIWVNFCKQIHPIPIRYLKHKKIEQMLKQIKIMLLGLKNMIKQANFEFMHWKQQTITHLAQTLQLLSQVLQDKLYMFLIKVQPDALRFSLNHKIEQLLQNIPQELDQLERRQESVKKIKLKLYKKTQRKTMIQQSEPFNEPCSIENSDKKSSEQKQIEKNNVEKPGIVKAPVQLSWNKVLHKRKRL